MNRWRVGEDRGSKEKDGCPLTPSHDLAHCLSIASHYFVFYLIPLIFACLLSHYLSVA
jgi:hypothetical protein